MRHPEQGEGLRKLSQRIGRAAERRELIIIVTCHGKRSRLIHRETEKAKGLSGVEGRALERKSRNLSAEICRIALDLEQSFSLYLYSHFSQGAWWFIFS